MQRRRRTRRRRSSSSVPSSRLAYAPLTGLAKGGRGDQLGAGGQGELPFRVELPSRRWLELAGSNGPAGGNS